MAGWINMTDSPIQWIIKGDTVTHVTLGDVSELSTEQLAEGLARIRSIKASAGARADEFEQVVAERIPFEGLMVESVGMVTRHRKKNRTKWDREALLSAVRDSRLVDKATGEVADESPLDKVLHVWNLGVPRLTALKARQIDGDEFATVELGGLEVRIDPVTKAEPWAK